MCGGRRRRSPRLAARHLRRAAGRRGDRRALGVDGELARFLDAGPPPIVFTLGSSVVWDAGRFYVESAAAARRLGRRAVLLVGDDAANGVPSSDDMAVVPYSPYGPLLPRAAAALQALFESDAPARAAALGRRIRAENGVGAACDVLERAL